MSLKNLLFNSKSLLGFGGVALIAGGLTAGLMISQNTMDDHENNNLDNIQIIDPVSPKIKLPKNSTADYIEMEEVQRIQQSINNAQTYTFRTNSKLGIVTVMKIDTCIWVYTDKIFYSTNCNCK